MAGHRPYSSRLTRGTLLMTHGPTLSSRYAHLGHSIGIESLGMIGAGTSIAFAGWFAELFVFWLIGTLGLLAGMVSWCIRRAKLGYRRRRTPGMLFISEEGIGAIMPDNASAFLHWEGLKAQVIRFPRPVVPYRSGGGVGDAGEMHGLMLRCRGGRCVYLTHDLDGYPELIDILLDLDIPIQSTESIPSGTPGGFIEWKKGLERRTWQERN